MDFRKLKSMFIGGKLVSKLMLNGMQVWKKADPGPAYDYEVEYVETDGVASYIDLGIVPDALASYEIDFTYVGGNYTGTGTMMNCAYGCATGRSVASAAHVLYFRQSDGFLKFAKPTSSLFTEVVPGVRFKVSVSAATDGKSSISVGDHVETVTNNYTAGTTMKFGCSYTESPDFYATARFYGAKFWKSGVLVRDLVPVVKDGEAGLYDKVEGKFYGNASGSGSITAGPKVQEKTPYIETDGVASYIDLGFVPTANMTYEIDVLTAPLGRASFVMSCFASRRVRFSVVADSYDGQVAFLYPTISETFPRGRMKLEYDGTSVSVNGTGYAVTVPATDAFTNLHLAETNRTVAYLRVYYAKFWESGELIRDLVPYSGPRGVGLLDRVNDVLYTNAGGGELTYGEE